MQRLHNVEIENWNFGTEWPARRGVLSDVEDEEVGEVGVVGVCKAGKVVVRGTRNELRVF